MGDKLGASADADRAATPSEPSPETVSGIAGIPCAECERLREEIADYLGHRTDGVAGKLWAAEYLFSMFKGKLFNVFPFSRVSTDDYDGSIEIHVSSDDMRLPLEAQQLIREAGFSKAYVNHPGEWESRWETHYTLSGDLPVRGWRRQRTDKGFNISYWPEGWHKKEWLETGYMTIVPDALDPFAIAGETGTAGT